MKIISTEERTIIVIAAAEDADRAEVFANLLLAHEGGKPAVLLSPAATGHKLNNVTEEIYSNKDQLDGLLYQYTGYYECDCGQRFVARDAYDIHKSNKKRSNGLIAMVTDVGEIEKDMMTAFCGAKGIPEKLEDTLVMLRRHREQIQKFMDEKVKEVTGPGDFVKMMNSAEFKTLITEQQKEVDAQVEIWQNEKKKQS